LENCAKSCLQNKTAEPFGCIFRDRCLKYCLDRRSCPQCRDIVKRVFTGYCYRNNFIERYGSKCRPLFETIARNYIK
uniref:Venom protein n=1 Tax=Gongylonema pulchrum TaxID=637853 RepID=A0A183EEF8_9BILA